jgi:hypothetical protein
MFGNQVIVGSDNVLVLLILFVVEGDIKYLSTSKTVLPILISLSTVCMEGGGRKTKYRHCENTPCHSAFPVY